jgi:cell division septation protein DedD
VALVLGVLGLLAGERKVETRAAADGRHNGDDAVPSAPRVQILSPQPPQTSTSAPSSSSPSSPGPLSAPAGAAASSPAAEALSAPVGGQIVAPPQADSATARAQEGTEGGVMTTVPAAPEAGARPDPRVDGIVLPQAALRSGGPGYRIQLGVFGDAGNALKLYDQVAAQGYEGHIQSRVMVGPFADRASAEKARQALRRAGVGQGVLVPPEKSK